MQRQKRKNLSAYDVLFYSRRNNTPRNNTADAALDIKNIQTYKQSGIRFEQSQLHNLVVVERHMLAYGGYDDGGMLAACLAHHDVCHDLRVAIVEM